MRSSKDYFNGVAGQWDRMRQGFFSEAVREKAYSVANLQPGKTAADIGAGTGFVTEGLLHKGLKVIAVDQSEAMIQELQRKFAGTDFRIGTAEHLPIDDESVDYVFANMYLHHVENPAMAIREMTRVLRVNGMLVVTDLDEHAVEFLKKEHHDRWMGFNRQDVSGWFKSAGLAQATVEGVGQNCCAASCCGSDSASVSIFVASGRKAYATGPQTEQNKNNLSISRS